MLHSLPSVVTKRYNTGGIDRRREMVQKKKGGQKPCHEPGGVGVWLYS